MLNIVCPHCRQEIKINQAKPGKFIPVCRHCKKKFALLIGRGKDGSLRFKTGLIKPKAEASSTSPNISPTQANSGTSTSSRKHQRADANQTDDSTKVEQTRADSANEDSSDSFETNAAVTSKTSPNNTPSSAMAAKRESSPAANLETAAGGATRADLATPAPPKPVPASPLQHKRLGAYQILKLLGQGGMGSVYLANQSTLDRKVALKVIKTRVSKNPSMLARFTREAYAAAQLVHPNVVQIYDMGDDKGTSFFSMELVNGCSLMDLIEKQKKLDPEQATSYILHAARGLQCAHNAGMVHRDIKPANLLVNRDGMVKVADLGLVKVPEQEDLVDELNEATALSASTDLTRVGSALGTPYYMAPEQAKSSTTVDHRADIYSLGCTFYVLLTGKRPFEGSSAQELVSKHSSAPLVLPSEVVDRVPAELNAIVARMMAKDPEERYQDVAELIIDLEKFLGLSSIAAFTPDEKDADTLEQCSAGFYQSPLFKLRGILPIATLAGCLLLMVLLFFVSPFWAIGMLLMPVFTVATYFVISGLQTESPIFERARLLVARSSIFSMMKWPIAVLLLLIVSFMTGTFVPILVLGLLGSGLGAAFYYLIDLPIARSGKTGLQGAEKLIRNMRLKGMNEESIHMFVAKYSGNQWEEFFEALFGYKAKRQIRKEISKSEMGKKKPKFRAWRDSICDSLDARVEELVQANEQRYLQGIEQAGLVAEGVSASEARLQAEQMAAALVDHGDSIRIAALTKQLNQMDPNRKRLEQRLKVKSLLADARSGKYKREQSWLQRMTPTLDSWLGGFPRFVIGCFLMIGCVMWANQNRLFDMDQLKETAFNTVEAFQNNDPDAANSTLTDQVKQQQQQFMGPTKPLDVPILSGIFYNFNTLLAGLILVSSAVVFGWKMSVFALPAGFVAVFGESLGVPALVDVNHLHLLSALIAIGLFVLGIVFGRRED
ncbi:MAG: serine/threonine-protein kinase [Planctomycetota bacterium]